MIINGFEKLSLVDYPGFTAATVFTGACNMRCPFCHNAVLVIDSIHQPIVEEQYVLDYLNKRRGIIDGLCITGGEPTLQKDLAEFIKKCRDTGVRIKLDSNGTNPEMLQSLIDQNLLDYVAMDIKNCKEKYAITANAKIDLTKIQESIDILEASGLDHEFRTTLVNEFHMLTDIERIAEWLDGTNKYFLQKFEDKGGCLQDGLHEVPIELAKKMQDAALQHIKHVELRSYE